MVIQIKELLNHIGSKGIWNNWKDNESLKIESRNKNRLYKHITLSYFIRPPSIFNNKPHKYKQYQRNVKNYCILSKIYFFFNCILILNHLFFLKKITL